MPVPRFKKKKKKQKLASTAGVTHLSKSTDKIVPKIIPPIRRNRLKPSVEVEVIINDCCYKDDNSQDMNTTGIVTTDELRNMTMNDNTISNIGISHTVLATEQPNHHSVNERNVYVRSEEQDQDDSGVYLPEAMPSKETKKHNSLFQTDFRSSDIRDTVDFTSKHMMYSDPVVPLADNPHKVSNENYVVTGLLKNFNSHMSVTNEDPQHLLDDAQTYICNTHFEEASTSVVDSTHNLIENVEKAINNNVTRICRSHDCKEFLKIRNSDLCMTFTSEFSVCISDGTGDVFHEREKDLSIEALLQNNVVHFMLPKEPVLANRALESSILLLTDQYHCNQLIHRTEGNTLIRPSGLGLLAINKKQTVSLVKNNTIQVKAVSSDISAMNDSLTSTINRNNYIPASGTIVEKGTVYEGRSLYRALQNYEMVTVSENTEQQWGALDTVKMFNREDSFYKSNSYKTHTRSEVHPNKISKNVGLFLKNMLMDSEECDLSCQNDVMESSINFKCALNRNKVTRLTENTNKSVVSLELNKEEPTKLPVHSKASTRCTILESHLESGVACDNVHAGSEFCNQCVCHSENSCVVSVVNVNTTVPSSNERSQSSLHREHQFSLISNYHSNRKNSEETPEDVCTIDKNTEDSINKISEDIIGTNNEKPFITVNKSDTLPSSGSIDTVNDSYNNSHHHIPISPKAQVMKIIGKLVKKTGVNDDCLDSLRIKMENKSG